MKFSRSGFLCLTFCLHLTAAQPVTFEDVLSLYYDDHILRNRGVAEAFVIRQCLEKRMRKFKRPEFSVSLSKYTDQELVDFFSDRQLERKEPVATLVPTRLDKETIEFRMNCSDDPDFSLSQLWRATIKGDEGASVMHFSLPFDAFVALQDRYYSMANILRHAFMDFLGGAEHLNRFQIRIDNTSRTLGELLEQTGQMLFFSEEDNRRINGTIRVSLRYDTIELFVKRLGAIQGRVLLETGKENFESFIEGVNEGIFCLLSCFPYGLVDFSPEHLRCRTLEECREDYNRLNRIFRSIGVNFDLNERDLVDHYNLYLSAVGGIDATMNSAATKILGAVPEKPFKSSYVVLLDVMQFTRELLDCINAQFGSAAAYWDISEEGNLCFNGVTDHLPLMQTFGVLCSQRDSLSGKSAKKRETKKSEEVLKKFEEITNLCMFLAFMRDVQDKVGAMTTEQKLWQEADAERAALLGEEDAGKKQSVSKTAEKKQPNLPENTMVCTDRDVKGGWSSGRKELLASGFGQNKPVTTPSNVSTDARKRVASIEKAMDRNTFSSNPAPSVKRDKDPSTLVIKDYRGMAMNQLRGYKGKPCETIHVADFNAITEFEEAKHFLRRYNVFTLKHPRDNKELFCWFFDAEFYSYWIDKPHGSQSEKGIGAGWHKRLVEKLRDCNKLK